MTNTAGSGKTRRHRIQSTLHYLAGGAYAGLRSLTLCILRLLERVNPFCSFHRIPNTQALVPQLESNSTAAPNHHRLVIEHSHNYNGSHTDTCRAITLSCIPSTAFTKPATHFFHFPPPVELVKWLNHRRAHSQTTRHNLNKRHLVQHLGLLRRRLGRYEHREMRWKLMAFLTPEKLSRPQRANREKVANRVRNGNVLRCSAH